MRTQSAAYGKHSCGSKGSSGADIAGAIGRRREGRPTAARGIGRTIKEGQDVGRVEETVAELQGQLADLIAEAERAADDLQSRVDPLIETLDTITIKPKKTNISVQLVALAWMPYWHDAQGKATPAWV